MDVLRSRNTADGHKMYSFLIADPTASIQLITWGEALGPHIRSGDILHITGAYTNIHQDSLVLYTGKNATAVRRGQYTMVFSEAPNMSEFHISDFDSMPPPPFIPRAIQRDPQTIPQ